MVKKHTIPVTLHLTKEQIKEIGKQLGIELEAEEDWMDDPKILKMVTDREKKVAKEIKEGRISPKAI
ncbi:MAG: hypothetical protein HY776_04375 [Actinobacteria bacterium]|nr:hypothetical protein [Actinomycetota bacterium]